MPGPEPDVWHRKSDGWYYSTINGHQTKILKAGKTERNRKRARVILKSKLAKPMATVQSHSAVAPILEAYLTHCEDPATGMAKGRVSNVRTTLQSFCGSISKLAGAEYGALPIADLGPEHAAEWLAGKTWSASTKSQRIQTLRTAFNWAKLRKKITVRPFDGFRSPGWDRREVMPTKGDLAKILKYPNKRWADFVAALVNTGARPSEVSRVTAADVDLKRQCWVLTKHKTKEKKPRPRVIWLNAKMLKLTQRLMKANPTGPLFRNSYGGKFTADAVVTMFQRFREVLKLEQPVTSYALRHEYITRSLLAGISVETVAEMCGTSPKMIWRNYAHLLSSPKHMLAAVEKAGRR